MKDFIDKIIADLGDDRPITGILLKSQIVASRLGNREFQEWISNEQNGYPSAKNIPDYRVLGAIVKADISLPFRGIIQNYTIPIGVFKEDFFLNKNLSRVRVTQSLSEIERLCEGNEDNNLAFNCPAIVYPEVNKYVDGNVERVWREVSGASILGIVDSFQSKLLAFFLDLDKKINAGVDFSKIEGKNQIGQIMNNYNISAGVVNTGSGTINTGDISDIHNTQYINDLGLQGKIGSLVDQLVAEADKINNPDLKQAVSVVVKECNKTSWAKSTLRMAFNAILGIATGITANQLTPIVAEALSLL